MDDVLGAFCPGPRVTAAGAAAGPLAGLTFAAKDNFDVAGHVTGAGSPDWARSHEPAARTAAAVSRLLAAGATLAGKTQMDELAYGVVGENAHYGTPINPSAPDRVPGGSSSGSAVAAAGGLVDFALGSDSACSVRLPAAVCGIFGLRPTHGRVPVDGLVPLSPSLDTVGWFARDPEVLRSVGRVLLTAAAPGPPPTTLLVAGDAFALAVPAVARALEPAIAAVRELVPDVESMRLVAAGAELGLDQFWFRVWSVQVREVWTIHGDWIMRVRPGSRVLTRDNLAVGAASTPAEEEAARSVWQELAAAVRRAIPPGTVLAIPTVADVAPPRGAERAARQAFARPTLCLMSIAGVAGLPQITLPAARVGDCPIGLSLIGPPGADEHLLDLAVALMGGSDPRLPRA